MIHCKEYRWLLKVDKHLAGNSDVPVSLPKLPEFAYYSSRLNGTSFTKEMLSETPSRTLTVKGGPAFVYINVYEDRKKFERARTSPEDGNRVHFSYCEKLKKEANSKSIGRFYCTTRTDGKFSVELRGRIGETEHNPIRDTIPLKPCKLCLGHAYDLGSSSEDWEIKNHLFDSFDFSDFAKRSHDIYLPIWKNVTNTCKEGLDWERLSKSLRIKHNYTCQECGYQAASNSSQEKMCIHVHHINNNRLNHHLSNLIVLCLHCHSRKSNHGKVRSSNWKLWHWFSARRNELLA